MEFLPTLYKLTSTGKVQEWSIGVRESANAITIETVYGQVDGKKQIASEVITEGKNVGRSNETTPLEQAVSEATSRWELKQKKHYVTDLSAAEAGTVDATFVAGGVAPMLAHGFDKQGHKITYPAFVQPKLDGHRCIAMVIDGKATLWSRTQKRINSMPHIEAELEAMYPDIDIVLDGELYNHEYRDRFEELTSKIRKDKPVPGHEVVQYHIYDVVVDGPFSARNEILEVVSARAVQVNAKAISNVFTAEAVDQDDLMDLFSVFVGQGFEGAIARNAAGAYKNKRSYDLQKIKEFDDAEFEVVAIEEGRGKMAGKALFVCATETGETFRCKMVGALDDLAAYLDNADEWIGKQLTVKFFGMTNGNVPRFPIGLRFREDV